jgi:hypothetical protein
MLYRLHKMLAVVIQAVREKLACTLTNRALGGIIEDVRHPGQQIQIRFVSRATHDSIQGYQYHLGAFDPRHTFAAAVPGLDLAHVLPDHGHKIKVLFELEKPFSAHYGNNVVRKALRRRENAAIFLVRTSLWASRFPENVSPTSEYDRFHMLLRFGSNV